MSLLILDYGVGNIKSLISAFKKFEEDIIFGSSKSDFKRADALILPGVGAFKHAMGVLQSKELDKYIVDFARTNKPILGICLGMQMLFSHSEEFGYSEGLDLIPGSIKRLDPKESHKLPNISWSSIKISNSQKNTVNIFEGIESSDMFYHIHSYFADPIYKENIIAETQYYDKTYCSVTKEGNIYGCQFHPEKSASAGLKLIQNFINIYKNYD
jgi:glutamine amidotransferase